MINVNNAKGNANDLNIVVQVPQQDDIQIRKVNWLGKALTNTFNWINGTSFTAILKVYGVIFVFLTLAMLSFVAYKIASNDNALLQVTNSLVIDKEKIEREAIRDDIVTPRIQEALTRIVYATNVDRICIFEFHNGKENASGLPFRYADMSYEEIAELLDCKVGTVKSRLARGRNLIKAYIHQLDAVPSQSPSRRKTAIKMLWLNGKTSES